MQPLRRSLFPLTLALLMLASQAQGGFDFTDVVKEAEALAGQSYAPPPATPDLLTNLPYDQFQAIRFRPDQSLWRGDGTRFQMMFLHPGLFFRNPVDVLVVDEQGAAPLAFEKSWFDYPPKLAQEVPNDLGFAGIKFTYPLSSPGRPEPVHGLRRGQLLPRRRARR